MGRTHRHYPHTVKPGLPSPQSQASPDDNLSTRDPDELANMAYVTVLEKQPRDLTGEVIVGTGKRDVVHVLPKPDDVEREADPTRDMALSDTTQIPSPPQHLEGNKPYDLNLGDGVWREPSPRFNTNKFKPPHI